MQASVRSNYHYYEGLDAWRGIAVLAVMLSHYFITTDVGQLCWISVEMFFVLSGFLITGILVKNKSSDDKYFRNFYIRRALRIVPLYYLFLISFYLLIHLWNKEELLKYYLVNWWYYPLFIQNWLFAFKGLPNEYYLNHLWSLSVEEQFYIMWPFIIYYIPQRYLLPFLLVFIGVICSLRVTLWLMHPNEINIYYCNTFTRIDSICMGCLLFCSGGIKRKYISGMLQVILIIILSSAVIAFKDPYFTNPFFATIGYTLIAFLFFLLLDSYIKSKRTNIIKKSWFLNYAGRISYGLYLTHVPVYFFIHAKLINYPYLAIVISFIITAVISALSFEFYEKRFLKLKRFFK